MPGAGRKKGTAKNAESVRGKNSSGQAPKTFLNLVVMSLQSSFPLLHFHLAGKPSLTSKLKFLMIQLLFPLTSNTSSLLPTSSFLVIQSQPQRLCRFAHAHSQKCTLTLLKTPKETSANAFLWGLTTSTDINPVTTNN